MKTYKRISLVDGYGNKLIRKIRRDSRGLYVVNHGMKGRLIKTVRRQPLGDDAVIIYVVRKVDYYNDM